MSTTTGVDAETLLAYARSLRPEIAQRALEAERTRRLPEETVDALRDSGLLRGVLPRRFGGSGIRLIDQIEIAAELARGCGSTAWVYTLLGAATSGVPSLIADQDGREEVLSDPRAAVAAVFASDKGTAKPVGGKGSDYVVSGTWSFASGCLHAQWFSGGVTFPDGTPGAAIMRISDVTIKDVWHVAGMRGTGSNTVVANEVNVPARRVGRAADPYRGGRRPNRRRPKRTRPHRHR